MIIRNYLLRKGYPIHWYIQSLAYAKDCMRELNFELPLPSSINTERILVNSVKEAPMPCGYVDWIRFGIEIGQFVKPLVQYNRMNRLPHYDANGQPSIYGTDIATDFGILQNIRWYYPNTNNLGQNTGGQFGRGTGREIDTLMEIRERGVFKIYENLKIDYLYLEYITDGLSSDSATKVNPYTQSTIEAYINWQYKENSRSYSDGEAQRAKIMYEQEKDKLRSYLSDLSLDQIKRSIQRGYHSTIR